jgi:hypothetical protein
VINKAYRAFWTCKGTFGKTWGLKPKALHWIYIMIIRPILTYSAMVGWMRVSMRELNRLQRLACLAIMGAMKTTPTAAMEVLLGLPPLHVITEAEAQAGIYRLICNQQWRPRSTNYGHAKKAREMEQEPILLMGTDGRMDLIQIIKEAWSGIRTGLRLMRALVPGCINGARGGGTPSASGITQWYSRLKYMPLRHCIMENTEKGYKGGNICILLDSHAAIKVLITSRLIPN